MSKEIESRYAPVRRFKRRKLVGRVAVVMEGRLRFETAAEISEGGMLLRMKEPMAIGTSLELRFFLPNDVFVSAHADVGYKLEPHEGVHFLGLRFVELSEEMRERISRFVASA
ncbi:MAG: PilZ domain-containing protein [Bdellovibrionota bacterium]